MELTDQQRKEVLINIERALYKKSYFEFFKVAVQQIEPSVQFHFGFYHQYLCNILQGEAERIHKQIPKTKDYIISIPPRSSKSLMFTSVFNAWLWLYYPQQKILSLSYGDELSSLLAYQTKLIFDTTWYQQLNNSFKLRELDNSKSRFSNDKSGARYSAGFMASITGFGSDYIMIDDAAKASDIGELKRTTVINQYKNTIYNRLNNPKIGVRFIIGQRIHESDLAGYLLANHANQYEHINLPVLLSDEVRPINLMLNYKDNMLLPELFDMQVINDYKQALGSYGFSSQYMQRPVPIGGGILKVDDFQVIQWQDQFRNLHWHMFVDSAFGKTKSDYSAILIAAKWDNFLLIKKSYQLNEEFPALIQSIKRIHSEHCNGVSKVYIEPKANGISIIQTLKKETQFHIGELKAVDDKITRCHAISPIVESKRVFLIDGQYVVKFIDEVTNFPLAVADDQTDTLIYAVDTLINKQIQLTYRNQSYGKPNNQSSFPQYS